MTTGEAKKLIVKYNAGECTEAEKAVLENWYEQYNEHPIDISQQKIEQFGKQVKKLLPGDNEHKRTKKLWPVIARIAAVSLIGIGTWLYFYDSITNRENTRIPPTANDIAPGGNKALLRLSNGKTINLSAAKTGIVIGDTKLAYNDGTAISAGTADHHSGLATITTPKGGEYQIVLPDGTKVWLNAATTLQFSANLKRERGDRKVSLVAGEAYFEVARDKKRPFVVATGNQEVRVLGTRFNINAYSTVSGIKTTLLEGSVKVSTNNTLLNRKSRIIKPGEQSTNNDGTIEVHRVNTDIELAWTKGKIQFVQSDLRTVMGMISRWYDVEVSYQYYPADGKFTGSISRAKNISEVLNLLETTGDVHFKIEGRKVIIMK